VKLSDFFIDRPIFAASSAFITDWRCDPLFKLPFSEYRVFAFRLVRANYLARIRKL